MRRADRKQVADGPRGAVSNPAGRFESTELVAGRRRLGQPRRAAADIPPPQLIAEFPKHAISTQPLARRPVRAVAEPVPGLRARLHLLLRAAGARVPQPEPRSRLRDAHLPQAGAGARCWRGRSPSPRLRLQGAAHRRQHRPVPARRTHAALDARRARTAARAPAPAVDHHQGRADPARPRPAAGAGARAASSPCSSASPASTTRSSARSSRVPPRRRRGCGSCANCAAAGVPVGVMMAPVIPALTDHEIERLLRGRGGRRREARRLPDAAPAVRSRAAVRGLAARAPSRRAPTAC